MTPSSNVAIVDSILPPTYIESKVELSCCAACGATKRASTPTRFESFVCPPHLARGLEVAIVGRHSINIVGIGQTAAAPMAAQLVAQFGCRAYATLPCACGFYREHQHECWCSPDMIGQYHRKPALQQALAADMHLEVQRPSWEEIRRWIDGQSRCEPHDTIVARVVAARDILDSLPKNMPRVRECDSLLAAAQRHLCLDERQVMTLLDIARTILAMSLVGAHSTTPRAIRPPNLAEAIQYRNRSPFECLEDFHE